MLIKELLDKWIEIWWNQKMPLAQIIVRMWKVFWDICRWERDAIKDKTSHNDEDLKKELGNIIFSTILWCNDLWYDPEECINIAIECQKNWRNKLLKK